METKSIFKSKTLWFNIATAIVAGATMINPELLAMVGITPAMEPLVLKIVGVVVAGANMYLRKNTNSAVVLYKNSPTIPVEVKK